MQVTKGKNRFSMGLMLLLVLGIAFAAQASSSHNAGFMSLMNPWNPANLAVEKAVERTLPMGSRLPHAGMNNSFSSMSFFTDYSWGKSNDKRSGGFASYIKSITVGADAVYNDSVLIGAIFNYTDTHGDNGAAADNQVYANTFTVYTGQSLSENTSWGASLSFSDSQSKVNGVTTDSDSWVFAPYWSVMTQSDNLTLSLTPSYILGYQKADYSATSNDDSALVGRFVLMSRAALAVNEKLSLSASLNFNQVMHNHGLDTDIDSDHNWFTYGLKMNYQLTNNVGAAIGYNSEFESDYKSDMWLASLSYMF